MMSARGFSESGPQAPDAWQVGEIVGTKNWSLDNCYVVLGASPLWGVRGGCYYVLTVKNYKKNSSDVSEEILPRESRCFKMVRRGHIDDL